MAISGRRRFWRAVGVGLATWVFASCLEFGCSFVATAVLGEAQLLGDRHFLLLITGLSAFFGLLGTLFDGNDASKDLPEAPGQQACPDGDDRAADSEREGG